jgi:16S rRNA (cytidine1402-2'-O)-methyltransferase
LPSVRRRDGFRPRAGIDGRTSADATDFHAVGDPDQLEWDTFAARTAALDAGAPVTPIPGPSAAIAMVSASGLVEGPFHFEGFLPSRARARDERLAALARMTWPFVLFEAPHRIAATLPAIAEQCGPERQVALGRELTKKFEEVHRCAAGAAAAWLAADANRQRGEYVLVVAGAGDTAEEAAAGLDPRRLLAALLEELPPSRAVKVATRATGLPHRELYQMALELSRLSGEADSGDSEH